MLKIRVGGLKGEEEIFTRAHQNAFFLSCIRLYVLKIPPNALQNIQL